MRRRMRGGRDAGAGTRGWDAGRGRHGGDARERLGTWSSMRGFAHGAWRALRLDTTCASSWSLVFAPDSPHRPCAGARGFDSRMSPALDFLAGVGRDHAGRSLDEIAAWNPRQLEQTHDYIQWVFPTMMPSRFNPHAPVLDAADLAAGARDERVVENLIRMAAVMGRFYGLERKSFRDGPQYNPIDDQRPWWMRVDNHNFTSDHADARFTPAVRARGGSGGIVRCSGAAGPPPSRTGFRPDARILARRRHPMTQCALGSSSKITSAPMSTESRIMQSGAWGAGPERAPSGPFLVGKV